MLDDQALEDLGARLFRRDDPDRRWRPAEGEASAEAASAEERMLYRCFAAGELRERASGRRRG